MIMMLFIGIMSESLIKYYQTYTMGDFPVDDGQLAVYLVFTFLSLAVSIAVYCLTFHGFKFADPDYA
jgi:hypothetical protein